MYTYIIQMYTMYIHIYDTHIYIYVCVLVGVPPDLGLGVAERGLELHLPGLDAGRQALVRLHQRAHRDLQGRFPA